MKFYEFNQHEYYGLLVAENFNWAWVGYSMEVCELTEGDNHPIEITKEEALNRYKKAHIECCITDEEKEQDFYKQLDYYSNPKTVETFQLLLIDSQLM